ncbi:FG-GAP-like repeat-containing protein [Meridianimaribacter flavus]|uniref:Secreted protein (Por secretion system target) n=1 Tax=Meridianimaribacter flavus TaxID=571115 RepID=A0ABY2G6E3_9FLAO|nr:FG-GAP-like repeat-containing protein [Meridianimaribacter flavus]TDY12625.1 putative secreted protein (Por secretion system target) [Meridianimaribacter flavus]
MKKSLVFTLALVANLSFSQIYFEDNASLLGLGVSCGDTPIGNGITFYDYNNDGWDDITLPSQSGSPLRFFKNINGTFVEEILISPQITSQVKQVNWVDIDNDGDKDLYVTSNVSGNRLFVNNGSMSFQEVTSTCGLPTNNIFTYGASWGDYNNDGYLDVFLSNRDVTGVVPNYLYKNNGDGTFVNVSNLVGILEVSDLSFCSAFCDYDKDGWQDIYVSNDRVDNPNVLYKNNGDGTFTDVSVNTGTNLYIDAMSVTVDDYNNDGWLDIYVTNTPSGNVLLQNNNGEMFTNVASTAGVLFNSIGWGAVFLDAENDMDLDLYVSGEFNGSVPGFLSAAFYENNGSGYYSLPSNTGFMNDTRQSFSNAIGDVNNDGFPEIVVSNADNENIFVWSNQTVSTNNWLKVKLQGTVSNRDGIGSLIEISINGEKQYRYTLCGEGYLSQNSGTEIFGLADNTVVDYVKVTWLSGIIDVIDNVNANQVLEIIEGENQLSINENEQTTFSFNNPVSDELIIKSAQNIKCVTLYNALGQELMQYKALAREVRLNLSHLEKGCYFIKMVINDNLKSFKIIKS